MEFDARIAITDYFIDYTDGKIIPEGTTIMRVYNKGPILFFFNI
jgi:hypothetical protein